VEPLLSPEQEPATNPFRWSGWRLPGFEREPIRWTREYWVPRRVLRAMWLCIMTGSLLGIIVAGVLVGEGRLPVRNFQLHSFIFQVSAFPTPLVRQPYALRIYCREGPNPNPPRALTRCCPWAGGLPVHVPRHPHLHIRHLPAPGAQHQAPPAETHSAYPVDGAYLCTRLLVVTHAGRAVPTERRHLSRHAARVLRGVRPPSPHPPTSKLPPAVVARLRRAAWSSRSPRVGKAGTGRRFTIYSFYSFTVEAIQDLRGVSLKRVLRVRAQWPLLVSGVLVIAVPPRRLVHSRVRACASRSRARGGPPTKTLGPLTRSRVVC
jgi:hypothetical protein